MNKKITIFAVIILILCLFWEIEVLAQSPTLAVSADSAQYFKVTTINDNEINCKFIYDYKSDQNELDLMHFNENCYLTIQNNTIFIDGESKNIVKSIDALNNMKDDMLIVAFLMEDVYDVEENGIHGDVSIIVYNINDNLIIDHSTPRYYQLQNEFSFYNNLDKSRLLVDEKKVYDENDNQYDVNSIVLWQDINVEANEEINMGEEAYNIYTDYNFVEIYWLDSDEQIEKAFLIELKDEEMKNNVIKILFGILLSLGGLVLIILLFKLGYKYLIQERKALLR